MKRARWWQMLMVSGAIAASVPGAAAAAPAKESGGSPLTGEDNAKKSLAERTGRLKATGPDGRNMAQHVPTITAEWSTIAAAMGAQVTFAAPQCFQGGCMLVTRHASLAGISQVLAELAHA